MRLVTAKRLKMAERLMTTRSWRGELIVAMADDLESIIGESTTAMVAAKDVMVVMMGGSIGTTGDTITIIIMSGVMAGTAGECMHHRHLPVDLYMYARHRR